RGAGRGVDGWSAGGFHLETRFSDLAVLAWGWVVWSGVVYVKMTKRENKSGTVRYLHLAHNEWDPVKGRAVPKVLFTFGREDDLDRDAVRRLVASLSKLLEPGDALAATAASDLEFVSSCAFGGTYVL